MIAQIAQLVGYAAVVFLFYLDRDKSAHTSKALWLPTIWLALAGSRPFSYWFGMSNSGSLEAGLDGSPFDAAVLGLLIFVAVIVALSRWKKVRSYLPVLTPIIAYSIYCLISVSWSPYPVPALKRWSKDLGDLVMVLLVVTDPQPVIAIRKIISRVGFILLPISIVLIRYTIIGRAWDADGNLAYVGITDNKNMLGLIVFLISLGTLWNVRSLFMNRRASNRKHRLIAECILLACGLYLLMLAHSSTSIACFLLGGGLILATSTRIIRDRPSLVHALCLGVIVTGALLEVFGAGGDVAHALGRESNLSGRTDMWGAMLPTVTNPLIGVGFDSFWTSPNAEAFHDNLRALHWYQAENINEAHDGYIEVYLNLGWIGICLMATILMNGYWRATKAFRRNPELGGLFLAVIMCGAIYSITEAGFRTLSPMWIMIMLSIVGASGISAGLFGREEKDTADSREWAPNRSYGSAGRFAKAHTAYRIADTQFAGRKPID